VLKKIIFVLSLLIASIFCYVTFIVVSYINNDFALKHYIKNDAYPLIINRIIGKSEKELQIIKTLPTIEVKFSDKEFKAIEIERKKLLVSAPNFGKQEHNYFKSELIVNDTSYKVAVRLRGDVADNYNNGLNNATLLFKCSKGEKIYGMKKFSLIRPHLERDIFGFLFYELTKNNDILTNQFHYIKSKFQGKNNGLFVLQEGFSRELINNNNKENGLILKFENDCYNNFNDKFIYYPNIVAYNEKKILKDRELSNQYYQVIKNYKIALEDNINYSKIFDVDKYAKLTAICQVLLTHHSEGCGNIRMFYNPKTELIEPIAWDPSASDEMTLINEFNSFDKHYISNMQLENQTITRLLVRNPEFIKKYTGYLKEYAYSSYISNFITKRLDFINAIEYESASQGYTGKFRINRISENIDYIRECFEKESILSAYHFHLNKEIEFISSTELPLYINNIYTQTDTLTINKWILPRRNFILKLDSIHNEKLIDFKCDFKSAIDSLYKTFEGKKFNSFR
tara:strand:+ start:973 stop:2508 length:1536 start_codon:yes stop_codon:yes gene_type:complete